ncbi:MAG: TlpA disulfide reductase family protein [Chloroflexi bacterium]|nr:TlpA disulfide reductase family protein [Chloroflexota bacterium]
MNKISPSVLLWLLIPVIIILIVTAAVIDRVTHPNATLYSAQVTASKPATQNDAKVGNRIGFAAPDFTLPTLDNKEIKLSDFRGKNVIPNFLATWCGPCRFEMPFFQAIHDEWDKSGVSIIAVATQDDLESTRSYAKAYNLKFTIPVDVIGNVAKKYGVSGMPTTFFINQDGVITSVKIGPFIAPEEIEDRMKTFDAADTGIR